jgi:hypothetical protein
MMVIGTGCLGEDDFFCLPAKGLFIKEDGSIWSNMPKTRDEKAYDKMWDFCWRHKIQFHELYQQIKSGKKMYLPKWIQDWVVDQFEKKD